MYVLIYKSFVICEVYLIKTDWFVWLVYDTQTFVIDQHLWQCVKSLNEAKQSHMYVSLC